MAMACVSPSKQYLHVLSQISSKCVMSKCCMFRLHEHFGG